MKKIKLLEKLNEIDDITIEKVIYIDSKEKLKEKKMEEKNLNRKKCFVLVSTCVSLCCIVIIGLFVFVNKYPNDRLQITNPLTEVNSILEMKKYLGYNVPILNSKEVKSYIVIGDGKYADVGRIIYSDDSAFDITKGNEDISGVYGATFDKKENISNVEVSFYTYEDIKYGIWTDEEYSYSYISSINDNNITTDIKYLIENRS